MAKKNPAQPRDKSTAKPEEKARLTPRDSLREMIESVVIAFVLAFLFRTFEAEAFVIPTGSMAPTLMGQHKDLRCANCNYPYRVSASEEEARSGHAPRYVTGSVCPICRYQMDFGTGGRDEWVRHATYKGDRILVAKFPYGFSDPKRWDVAVFKNPGEAKQNYIKRVVGLPNETVVICHGDVHTTQEPDVDRLVLDAAEVANMQREEVLQIERKPPEKVEAMLQVVHDNDYLPPRLPQRWQPQAAQASGWTALDEGKSFAYDGKRDGDAVVAYRHLVAAPETWTRLAANPSLQLDEDEVPPRLITDFYAYNTSDSDRHSLLGTHWVGDLAIECRVEVQENEGDLLLRLVEGGVVFECRIDVATGLAAFTIPGDRQSRREGQTAVRGAGTYRLRFANVDDQLLLWVNGKVVDIDGRYGPFGPPVPNAEDLLPVRLGTKGLAAQFSELRVLRDVYYIAADRHSLGGRDNSEASHSASFFHDPRQWNGLARSPAIALTLAADHFMVCGDNSPRSFDSRLWVKLDDETGATEYYVKRDLLIGKAVYIYWPHALPIPGLPDWWCFQLIPNVPRMGFVR